MHCRGVCVCVCVCVCGTHHEPHFRVPELLLRQVVLLPPLDQLVPQLLVLQPTRRVNKEPIFSGVGRFKPLSLLFFCVFDAVLFFCCCLCKT